jgi:predicted ferric reductase
VGNRGDDTAALQHLKPGTRLILEGPYGVFTEEKRTKQHVVLIAAGIGIPPIRALAESMAATTGDLTVIYRVKTHEDAPLLRELEALCEQRGIHLHVLAGKRGAGSWMSEQPGAVQVPDVARMVAMAPFVSEADVYVCGPSQWTHQVVKTVSRAGTPADHIHAEEFAW